MQRTPRDTDSNGEIRLKTVYDATRPDPTGIFGAQLRLHVASWKKYVHSSAGLTVTCIGKPSREILLFLDSAGAEAEIKPERHRLYHRSPTYNKHLAAPPPGNRERIFLTDNDTIYLRDIAALTAVPPDTVALHLADLRRVSPELWDQLLTNLSIPVILHDWVPWKEKGVAEVERRRPVTESLAYFNSGAVLFPAGNSLWHEWEERSLRISAFMEGRGLHDRRDAGSDQLSLTAAVAAHGRWQLLPEGYNMRLFRLWLPDTSMTPVVHLHMVNTKRVLRALRQESQGSLSALLKRYWSDYLDGNIADEHKGLASDLLRQALDLVAEFGLDTRGGFQ